MGNTTSVIRRANAASANTFYVFFLPLVGGEKTWSNKIDYYAPGKPSRGYWFHAARSYIPPARHFIAPDGSKNYYGGIFYSDASTATTVNGDVVILRGNIYEQVTAYRPKGSSTMRVDAYQRVMTNGRYSEDGKYALYDYVARKCTWKLNDSKLTLQDIVGNYVNYLNSATWAYEVSPTTIKVEIKWPNTTDVDWVITGPPRMLDFDYKYNELNNWFTIYDLQAIPSRLAPGLSAAYLDTIRNIPAAQTNAIETCRDSLRAISTIAKAISTKSVTPLIKGLTKSVSSPKDMWLSYRYMVNTSAMDLEDVRSLTCRLRDLKEFRGQTLTLRSTYVQGDICYRCAATFILEDLLPHEFTEWLDAYGFRLDLENIWDLVPFSFIVDWFFHIGNFLGDVDNLYLAHQYKPVSIWYSYETSYDGQVVYTRFPGPALYSSPFSKVHSSSSKTWVMRIADVISIFG